jgi:tetratricopeptide (TPR) repeat protein
LYTNAIEDTPGPTGAEILEQQTAWEQEQNLAARKRMAQQDEERRKERDSSKSTEQKDPATNDATETPEKFVLNPPHPHGAALAIFYCNRAACSLQLQRNEDAVKDCDIALLVDPTYGKAWMRRATSHERLEHTDLALADAKQALALETNSSKRLVLQKTVSRLQKLEDARLEKIKAETMDKLKDLGNSILGNFGLSLDNFQAQQDPQTGSYNISFQQNS